jgi:transposase
LIPKSICTPSLLSHILISKFCDSLPFYRQEQQFHRFGIVLSRGSMCIWAVKVAEKCKRLVELLHHAILSGPLINIDETTFQVLCEPDRRVDSKSYMWVFRGGPPGKVAVLYIYDESRSGSVASEFLGDFQGYVQTDGFSGYDFLDIREGIIHVGCWAHARRKFFDVVKAFVGKSKGKDKGKGKNKGKGLGKAGEALQIIRDLYAIEKKARDMDLPPELIYEERQKKSKPILDKFKLWLQELAPTVPPKSLLGKALNYTLRQWPRLIKYLDNGILRMDNNLVENDIRPFVVGRKNWLFFDQPGGAEAGATLYSLIETAKANGLEPYHYLLYLFDKLPGLDGDSMCDDQLRALLPMDLTSEILADHKKEYLKARGQEGT